MLPYSKFLIFCCDLLFIKREYDFHKKRLQTIRSNSSNMYYNHQHVENIKAHNAQRQHANKFYETVKQTEIASNNNKILRKIIQISSHSKEIPNISNIQQSVNDQIDVYRDNKIEFMSCFSFHVFTQELKPED